MKKYTDVFAWSYEDLKGYDTYIIQHTIPIVAAATVLPKFLKFWAPPRNLIIEPLSFFGGACFIFKCL